MTLFQFIFGLQVNLKVPGKISAPKVRRVADLLREVQGYMRAIGHIVFALY